MQELTRCGRGGQIADGRWFRTDRCPVIPGQRNAGVPLTAWISASNAGFHGATPLRAATDSIASRTLVIATIGLVGCTAGLIWATLAV